MCGNTQRNPAIKSYPLQHGGEYKKYLLYADCYLSMHASAEGNLDCHVNKCPSPLTFRTQQGFGHIPDMGMCFSSLE